MVYNGPMTKKDLKFNVAVVGLGYVGLPLMLAISNTGLKVVGIDNNKSKIDLLNRSKSYIQDIPDLEVTNILKSNGIFMNNKNFSGGADVWVICVPTPLTEDLKPDLSFVLNAVTFIANFINDNDLVILESTTYPGTTDTVIVNKFNELGKFLGKDYLLAYAPERVDPGQNKFAYPDIPRVVGGVDDKSADVAVNFYSKIVRKVVKAKSSREAEMSKLLENTFRHINIALVNELSQFCSRLNIDIWNTIECSETKPFGFMRFNPGPGVGGHCIPIDPNYLSYEIRNKLGQDFRFVELATKINSEMPQVVTNRINEILQKDLKYSGHEKITLLGMSYKKNISDTRESPSIKISKLLVNLGYAVNYFDPLIEDSLGDLEHIKRVYESRDILNSDILVILQFHDVYKEIEFEKIKLPILDMTGNLQLDNVEHI